MSTALVAAMRNPVRPMMQGLMYTPVFRLAFPHLDAPWGGDEAKKIPPSFQILAVCADDANLTEITTAVDKSLTQRFGPQALELLALGSYRYPILPKRKMAVKYAGFEGTGMYLNLRARQDSRPMCIDASQGKNVILQVGAIENVMYSGCFCYATVSAYSYDKGGGKGVSLNFRTLVKVADGERFGGMAPTSEDEAMAAVTGVELPGLVDYSTGAPVIDGKAEEIDPFS